MMEANYLITAMHLKLLKVSNALAVIKCRILLSLFAMQPFGRQRLQRKKRLLAITEWPGRKTRCSMHEIANYLAFFLINASRTRTAS
jgi:hypothetical protein